MSVLDYCFYQELRHTNSGFKAVQQSLNLTNIPRLERFNAFNSDRSPFLVMEDFIKTHGVTFESDLNSLGGLSSDD